MIFNPKEMLGILDVRLIGYYKIKQGILQPSLIKERKKGKKQINIHGYIKVMKGEICQTNKY